MIEQCFYWKLIIISTEQTSQSMYQSLHDHHHAQNSNRLPSYQNRSTTNYSRQGPSFKYREKGLEQADIQSPYSQSLKLKQKKSISNSDDSVDTCESQGTHGDSSDLSFSKTKHQDSTRSKNKLKVELCKNFIAKGYCPYESRCRFAHGLAELRAKEPHHSQLYRTRLCKVFFEKGECRFGQRCNFRHQKQQEPCQRYPEAPKCKTKNLLRELIPCLYLQLMCQDQKESRLMGLLKLPRLEENP